MTYLSEQIADGVLGAWMLGDAAGATTAVDSSGNARNGTHTNTGPGVVPMIGTATGTDFNGNNSVVQIASGTWMNVTNMTVEAVVRPLRVPTIYMFSARESATSSNRTYQFRMTAAGLIEYLFFDPAGVTHTVTGATAVSAYQKFHAAATYDGTTAKVYLNGVLDGSLSITSSIRIPATATAIELGRVTTSGGSSAFWLGQMAGHGFYGAALSAARIAAHAAAITSGAPPWDGSGTWGLVA